MNVDKGFLEQLLQALKDDEVKQAIRSITALPKEALYNSLNHKTYIKIKQQKESIEENKECIQQSIVYGGCNQCKETKEKNYNLGVRIKTLEEENRILRNQNNEFIEMMNSNKNILDEVTKEKSKLEDKLTKFILDIQVINDKNNLLENELKEKNIKMEVLLKRFKEFSDLYAVYNSLSQRTISSLNGIFRGNTVEEFIFCGVQQENIQCLWEFNKGEVLAGRLEEIKKLDEIFRYFLNANNKIYEDSMYEIQTVHLGEVFDEDKHIRHIDSKVVGNISEVIFNGYINIRNAKIVKKSIVKI